MSKVDILPKTFSDHNPVLLILKKRLLHYRWRLNETILQKKVLKDYKEKLKYFNNNLGKGMSLMTVWKVSKAVRKGYFIQYNHLENKSQENM